MLIPKDWFERTLVQFGQTTGVAASSLLLRMADPENHSDALP
jgi:ESS family glutamate:Na+ symporter